jgi:hypothetical protein
MYLPAFKFSAGPMMRELQGIQERMRSDIARVKIRVYVREFFF